MRKNRIQQMIEKGKCVFCEEPLVSDKERSQGLCGRCYNLRREVKKWKGR